MHNVLVKALAAGSTSQSLVTAGCLASSSYLFIEIPSNMTSMSSAAVYSFFTAGLHVHAFMKM